MRDDEIDALVRRAAETPVNTARLQAAVRARIATPPPGLFGWMHGPALAAPAVFAVLLVATPVALARLPAAGPDALIEAVALGDPLLFGPGGLP
jgi:hypothetical protein